MNEFKRGIQAVGRLLLGLIPRSVRPLIVRFRSLFSLGTLGVGVIIGILGNNATPLFNNLFSWFGERGDPLPHWVELSGVVSFSLALIWAGMNVSKDKDLVRLETQVDTLSRERDGALARFEAADARVDDMTVRVLDRISTILERHRSQTLEQSVAAEKLVALQARSNLLLVQLDTFRSKVGGLEPGTIREEWENWLRSVLADLADVFGKGVVEHATVLLPEADKEYLGFSPGSWVSDESVRTRSFYCGPRPRPLAECGVAGVAFQTRTTLHIPNVHQTEYDMAGGSSDGRYQAIMAAPIGNEGPPLGVITVATEKEAGFDDVLDRYVLWTHAGVLAHALRHLARNGVHPHDLLTPGLVRHG